MPLVDDFSGQLVQAPTSVPPSMLLYVLRGHGAHGDAIQLRTYDPDTVSYVEPGTGLGSNIVEAL